MNLGDNNVLVVVPTKNRLNNQRTGNLLRSSGVDFIYLLEPQEYNAYQGSNKINIIENDEGIAYVRNYAIQYARQQNKEWLIMLDDDIDYFATVTRKKTTRQSASYVLTGALNLFNRFKKPVNGLQYVQFGLSGKEVTANRFCEVVVFLYVPKIKFEYDATVNLKEDRDFSLQAITKGEGTLRANWYVFSCPSTGTNQGGLYDQYRQGINERSSIRMAQKYPGMVEVHTKEGVKDIKVNWKKHGL